jgi:hypothetical protein
MTILPNLWRLGGAGARYDRISGLRAVAPAASLVSGVQPVKDGGECRPRGVEEAAGVL